MSPSDAVHAVEKALVATQANGRVDWRAYTRLWPVVAFILLATFYLGGRLETPAQKQARIDRSLAPLAAAISRIDDAGGHPVTNRRLDALERQVAATHEREARAIERLAGAVERFVSHQTGASP